MGCNEVKASLSHGEWLPWLNGEIESGRLKVKARQANTYMKIASNPQRDADLLEAPSIRAALELLSDKEPAEQQGALIDGEVQHWNYCRMGCIEGMTFYWR